MPKNSSNRSKGAKSRNRGRQGTASLSHPPQFSATKRFSGRARYVATGSTTGIARGHLLSHLVMNAAGSTTNYRLLSAIRLKSIEVWASTATLGQTVTASVEWLSTNGPSTLHSDTSMGTAEPLHILSRPPANSNAGFWSVQGASDEAVVLFILTVPANAIVDITYDAIIQNGESASSQTTTASGTAGVVYMTYLAGITSTTFVPVSYPSLT